MVLYVFGLYDRDYMTILQQCVLTLLEKLEL